MASSAPSSSLTNVGYVGATAPGVYESLATSPKRGREKKRVHYYHDRTGRIEKKEEKIHVSFTV